MFPLKLFVPLLLPLLALSFELPPWVPISGGIFVLWRFAADFFKWKKPSRKITGAISILFMIGIFFSFSTLLGREAAGSFLFILTGLKILEYEKEEESLFLILLGVFLICTVFLFNLDLLLSLALGIALFYFAYLMIPENLRNKSPSRAMKIYAKTVIASIPLTVFLFLFFPRLSEVLWRVGTGQAQSWALSGFSDELKPGSIGEIVKSNKTVFRSEFLNSTKLNRDLYWRGEVLTKPFGMRWNRSAQMNESYVTPVSQKEPDYRVMLEPQGQRWLFTLEGTEFVNSVDNRITIKPTHVFRVATQPEKSFEYYGIIDYSRAPEPNPSDFLELPSDISEKVLLLVNSWKLNGVSPEKKLDRIMEYFQKEKFHYTLNPGDNGALTLDKFLFETKKGFCEHYSSSLALLLRIAGVPARVVVGFQGGVYNDFGKFWLVREKEAHAWVEYLGTRGRWKRADATSVVAPLRLELGAEDFFNLPEEMRALKKVDETIQQLRKSVPLYEQAMYWLQGLNYRWTSWLMNFDLEKQKELLNKLPVQPQFIVMVALLICLGAAYLIQRVRPKKQYDQEDFYYAQVLEWAEIKTIPNLKSLGPTEFLAEAEKRLPELANELQTFFKTYIVVAYGSQRNQMRNLKTSFKILLSKYKSRSL